MTRRLTDITGQPIFAFDHTFRLEPVPRSNEVASGLAARTHDAAWLLTRQWQLGEFAGQDAGSPVTVSLSGRSQPVTAWRPWPADGPTPRWRRYRPDQGPLEPRVEAEPPAEPDVRTRVEGGLHLVALLREGGARRAVAPLTEACPFQDVEHGAGVVTLLAGAVPDAAAVARRLADGTLPDVGAPEVLSEWSRWWTALTAGQPGRDAFDEHRFEHRLELACGDVVLRAEEYLGDGLDWHVVDAVDAGSVPGVAAPRARAYTFATEALATPIRYAGLPADRFWEMEDASVDLASAEVDKIDTGRLLLIGFAEVYGNDWFSVPLEVPVGSLTRLGKVVVADSFGDRWLVDRAGADEEQWNLFRVTGTEEGLLVMPGSHGTAGQVLESVLLVRDELANTAWAIERTVCGPDGEPQSRHDEWLRHAPALVEPAGLPAYAVQTLVPDYWLPLVPERTVDDQIRFRLKRLRQEGVDSEPRGVLLTPGQWVHEEEVPREGAQLTRRSVLARWFDGSWHAWTRREKDAGSGEASSGLVFDLVRPGEPWA